MPGVYVLVLAFAATEILTLDTSAAVMLSTVSSLDNTDENVPVHPERSSGL
jgi:hypothetical protein